MYRYNPYMFEDMQEVAVPRRGMSRRAKLLAGLAGLGALGAGAYATRNMKYGVGTLGRRAWNSDRVQGGITNFAKSSRGRRLINSMENAQINSGSPAILRRAMKGGGVGDRIMRDLQRRRRIGDPMQ